MVNQENRKSIRNVIEIAVILLLCGLTLALDYLKINYVEHELRNKYLSKIIQQGCGGIAAILLINTFLKFSSLLIFATRTELSAPGSKISASTRNGQIICGIE